MPQVTDYSRHPKPGPFRVSNGHFWPVPGIWMPDHLKPGRRVRVSKGASLDRFTNKGHKKYFIHAKTV